MTAEAILLRPMGPALARRVACALAGTFVLVLTLSWYALDSLAPASDKFTPGAAAARLAVRPAANMQPPAGVLTFRPGALDGPLTAARLLDPTAAALLSDWSTVLRERAGTRVSMTLSCAEGIDALHQRRVGAALVRLLTAGDINPHRVELALTPAGPNALSPGEFRLTIDMSQP